MDAAEYKHLVLGLIFVKYISDTFAARRAELTTRLSNPADEYYYGDAAPEDLAAELEDRDYYTEVNAFWVPEPARWESLRAAAKQPDIGKRIDDALSLIEQENPKLKGILDKRYARAQLPDGKLGELVDLISTIGFGDNPSTARDVLGQVYEYFYGDADPADIEAELEDRDYYKEVNVFWVPEGARWEALRNAAKQPDIGKRIDDALTHIEAENPKLKGILDKRYARAQLPDGKLGELVDLVSTIGFGATPDVARAI